MTKSYVVLHLVQVIPDEAEKSTKNPAALAKQFSPDAIVKPYERLGRG